MNKLVVGVALSFKRELYIVLGTLSFLLLLPFLAVVVIANAGVAAVSNALVSVNPTTHQVEIRDANGNKIRNMELSTVWPTSGIVTSTFGAQESFRSLFGYGRHTGIDIANDAGTPITSFTSGKVVLAGVTSDKLCGVGVRIDHGSNIQSLYCHMSSVAVSPGVEVKPGDVIGYMGTTGASTGNHLHFEVQVNNIPVDPRTFMVGEP